MTVFYDRRTAAYKDLTDDESIQYVTGIVGQNNAATHGYSGGQLPPLSNTRPKYPVDQTASVVNMR